MVEKRGPEFYPPEEDNERPWTSLPQADQSTSGDAQNLPPLEQGGPPPQSPQPTPANAPRSVPLLAYVTALLAVGFLIMTAVCVLQFRANQNTLDEVREIAEDIQTLDQLREENEQFREENAELEISAAENLQKAWEAEQSELIVKSMFEEIKLEQEALRYIWFIQNFMEDGNYAMAANALCFGGYDAYRKLVLESKSDSWNAAGINFQFLDFYSQLVQLNYLRTSDASGDGISLNKEIPENARWFDLWAALSAYYFDSDSSQAAICLVNWTNDYLYLLDQPESIPEEQYWLGHDSFTTEQYWILRETLSGQGYIRKTEDGGLEIILDGIEVAN